MPTGIGGISFVPGNMELGGLQTASVNVNPAVMQMVASQVVPSASLPLPTPQPTPGVFGQGIYWEFIGKTSVNSDLVVLPRLVGSSIPRILDLGQRTVTFTLSAKQVERSDADKFQGLLESVGTGSLAVPLHNSTGLITGTPTRMDRTQIPGMTQENLTLELIVAEPFKFDYLARTSIVIPLIHAKFISANGGTPPGDQIFNVQTPDQTITVTAKYAPPGVGSAIQQTLVRFGSASLSVPTQNGSVTGLPIRFDREEIEGTNNENLSLTLLVPFPF